MKRIAHTPLRVSHRAIRLALLFVVALSGTLTVRAEAFHETAHVITDKDCYLTGEQLLVSILITDAEGQASDVSRTAIAELSDTRRVCAQGMAALTEGRGWTAIDIPSTLHSGNYLLSVYTRTMPDDPASHVFHKVISVINALHLTRDDDLLLIDNDSVTPPSAESMTALSVLMHEDVSGSSPVLFRTLSVVRDELTTADYTAFVPSLQPRPEASAASLIPEKEGHLAAAITNVPITSARLVAVGGKAALFDGQRQDDGTWLFYTDSLYNRRAVLLEGSDSAGVSFPLEFLSPCARLLPQRLPRLEVMSSRERLARRSVGAQLVAAQSTKAALSDTLVHETTFFASEPLQFYDLDEWTRFNSVREILTEFIRGVRRVKNGKVTRLYVYDNLHDAVSKWPALVLLDGVPVHDIDGLLDYDARLLKYVQIYNDRYTFGASIHQGIISFISKQGLLTNYRLDEGLRPVTRLFPLQRPDYVVPSTLSSGTLAWNPALDEAALNHLLNSPYLPELKALIPCRLLLQEAHADGSVTRSILDLPSD